MAVHEGNSRSSGTNAGDESPLTTMSTSRVSQKPKRLSLRMFVDPAPAPPPAGQSHPHHGDEDQKEGQVGRQGGYARGSSTRPLSPCTSPSPCRPPRMKMPTCWAPAGDYLAPQQEIKERQEKTRPMVLPSTRWKAPPEDALELIQRHAVIYLLVLWRLLVFRELAHSTARAAADPQRLPFDDGKSGMCQPRHAAYHQGGKDHGGTNEKPSRNLAARSRIHARINTALDIYFRQMIRWRIICDNLPQTRMQVTAYLGVS